MPSKAHEQGSSKKKKKREVEVIDMEPVLVVNRRGNKVYRPQRIVVENNACRKSAENIPASGTKRRRAPSVPEDFSVHSEPEHGPNQTKKSKGNGRRTMVREGTIQENFTEMYQL